MELTKAMEEVLANTAAEFHQARRRRFMAETVEAFGLAQRQAERQLGWCRDTLRKAQHELHSGIPCVDNFSARGRQPIEFHLPDLFQDIRDRVKANLPTDPTFQTTGLYCRLSAPEVRQQLITHKGYTDKQLPTVQTIGEGLVQTDKVQGNNKRQASRERQRPEESSQQALTPSGR